ncbi:hypothetical protein J4450_07100 [Candidatus Micrarchaeota archaeon]|nr:hypothetical protein [Candidatus Micrarchaeota archaeon]
MKLFILLVFISLFLSGCLGNDKSLCPSKPGYVKCGYCAEDAAFSDNPNIGQCTYCPTGTQCSGDPCEGIKCVKSGSGNNYDNDNNNGYSPPSQKQYYASCSGCEGGYRTYSYRGYSYETCNAYYQVCVEASCEKILDNCR